MIDRDPSLERVRQVGWTTGANGIWQNAGRSYSASVQVASQSWDRQLTPLLAQAFLESKAASNQTRLQPLAVLIAPKISEAMHERLLQFASRVAPHHAWIAADREGRIFPHFPEAPELESIPWRPLTRRAVPIRQSVNLFSDLHQWMLKVLLAQHFPDAEIAAPRRPIRNARMLAEVAQVSPAGAARFVHAMSKAGYLEVAPGELRLVQAKALLQRWRTQVPSSYSAEASAQFVRAEVSETWIPTLFATARAMEEQWKTALGLFDACKALNLSHVRGGPHHVYVSSFEPAQLEKLGLVIVDERERADLHLRIPQFPQALFRARPVAESAYVTDLLQTWLDVSHHPARGEEQADFLWRRAILPAIEQL